MLRLLLERDAEPDVKTVNGMTPLMEAALRAKTEAMRLLITKGADARASNTAGRTVLMAAASTHSPEAVRLLLEKGADPNVVSKRKDTALSIAATAGVEETVKLLLDHGAKVDVPDDRGYTALLYAAGSDAIPTGVVKLLSAKGASQEFKGDGETARMLAAKRGNTPVLRLLGGPEQDTRDGIVATIGESVRNRSVPDAVAAALALLEKQSYNFIRIGGCNSCHAQDLPSAAAALARTRGLAAPKEIPQLPQHMQPNNPERLMDLAFVVPVAGPTALGWELFDLGMNQAPANRYTDAAVRFIKSMQMPEGGWYTLPQNRRPPMTAGAYQTAALAIYALKHYGPTAEEADTRKSIARAAAWLESAKPSSTQDRAFHLLGLAWAEANPAIIRSAAKALGSMQREDGGWSQLPALGSDAYATGQALYALNVGAKMPAADRIYRKGVDYLMRTQAPDGSWHVKSRSIWLQPYFESGFPYGHDQWISVAGTAWASMALALSVEPKMITQNASRN